MNYNLLVLVHIVCAIVFVGAGFLFWIGVFPALIKIPDERMIVRASIRILLRYLKITFFISVLLGGSGVFLAFLSKVYVQDPILKIILYTKGYIWFFMSSFYIYAFFKVKKARSVCFKGDSFLAVEMLRSIANYVFVLNFVLGIVAVYFGIMLRG